MFSSVSRALAILHFLAEQAGGASLTEIVAATDIEKSAVSRILATLEHERYVVRNKSAKYFIGLKFVSMGLLQLELTGLFRLCLPILERIADESGELVQLAIADSEGLNYVAKADGNDRIRVQPRLGTRAALHATAVGKVWLASLPEELALKLALSSGLEAHTENTITTVEGLRTELARVRQNGFAINRAELFGGVKGVAVPIFNQSETVVTGAIVIVAPEFRMSDERAESFLPLLRRQAASLRGVECLTRTDDASLSDAGLLMAN